MSLCLLYYISLSDKYMTHALRKIFIQLILLAIKTNNKTFIINFYFIWHSFSGRQTGGLLPSSRPARLGNSAATLLLWPPTGGLLPSSRPARLGHSTATLLLWPPDGRASSVFSARPSGSFHRHPPPLAARRAGFFRLLGPPIWVIPSRPSSSGRQTGGLLPSSRPARLGNSAATFLLWPPDGRASSVFSARPSG